MDKRIEYIRSWVRTNGTMSEDGETITYNCKELEDAIEQALTIPDVNNCAEFKHELEVTAKLLNERQKLLDAIPECEIHGKCVPHALEWIEEMKKINEIMNTDNINMEGNAFNTLLAYGWVDCENSLPKEEGEYLTYNKDNGSQTVQYFDGRVWGYLATVEPNVTHWTNLPSVPEECH